MFRQLFRFVLFLFMFLTVSCGIKGKPLPPIEATTQETDSGALTKEKKK
jgi:hypothetical protein